MFVLSPGQVRAMQEDLDKEWAKARSRKRNWRKGGRPQSHRAPPPKSAKPADPKREDAILHERIAKAKCSGNGAWPKLLGGLEVGGVRPGVLRDILGSAPAEELAPFAGRVLENAVGVLTKALAFGPAEARAVQLAVQVYSCPRLSTPGFPEFARSLFSEFGEEEVARVIRGNLSPGAAGFVLARLSWAASPRKRTVRSSP